MGQIDASMTQVLLPRLEVEFGELSKTLLFEHQTLAELADYFTSHHPAVVTRLTDSQPAAVSTTETTPPAPVVEAAVSSEEPRHGEDIAIIGVAGRYPHGPGDLRRVCSDLLRRRRNRRELRAMGQGAAARL